MLLKSFILIPPYRSCVLAQSGKQQVVMPDVSGSILGAQLCRVWSTE